MKRLTKGQYEALAGVFKRGMDATEGIPTDNIMYKTITEVIATLAGCYADLFEESDPEFKRDVFLKGCGLTAQNNVNEREE